MKKLKSDSGETMVETLFALLIVVLALLMLSGSIVTAARVNKGAASDNVTMNYEVKSKTQDHVKISVTHDAAYSSNGGTQRSKVTLYTTKTDQEAGYMFYETEKQ